jgi:hypothetical protein
LKIYLLDVLSIYQYTSIYVFYAVVCDMQFWLKFRLPSISDPFRPFPTIVYSAIVSLPSRLVPVSVGKKKNTKSETVYRLSVRFRRFSATGTKIVSRAWAGAGQGTASPRPTAWLVSLVRAALGGLLSVELEARGCAARLGGGGSGRRVSGAVYGCRPARFHALAWTLGWCIKPPVKAKRDGHK